MCRGRHLAEHGFDKAIQVHELFARSLVAGHIPHFINALFDVVNCMSLFPCGVGLFYNTHDKAFGPAFSYALHQACVKGFDIYKKVRGSFTWSTLQATLQAAFEIPSFEVFSMGPNKDLASQVLRLYSCLPVGKSEGGFSWPVSAQGWGQFIS
jgi:hypothetical protein